MSEIKKDVAGPELDDSIAQLMGWKHQHPRYGTIYGFTKDSGHAVPPPFSISISTAWLIVERLRTTKNLRISILCFAEQIACRIDRLHEDDMIEELAETAPLAICLAVKKLGSLPFQ